MADLELKVTADTSQAQRAINRLEKSLANLSNTMNTFTAGKAGKGLNELSNSLEKISQSNTKLNTRGLNSLLKSQNGLAQGSYNVARSTRSLSSAFDGLIPRIGKANRTTKGFVSSIGMFYAKFFLAIRAVRGLGNSIKSAMGMLETYNYFDNVIQTLSKKQVESMGDIGTDSAKAYYDSFYEEYSKQARDLTRKMSGYEIDERGMMRRGDAINLGLDPNLLMNYQAQFAQLATSMGNTADNGMKLSRALSEISADLASVKNMDFKDVMDNMSSGLVGMSRATDKFGINIRNTALQEKLYELGIDKSIAKMSQADKALLRTIVILDSSRYAWGDLSRTLDAPANQLRVLQASFASLSRTIGSMFLGVLQQILPYINAVVIALQRLAQYIIDFFGIQIPNVTSQAGDMSNFADAIEEASDNLGTGASNAKKLKQNLLGIDELNVINDSGSSASGSPSASATPKLQAALDAILDEYQKVWDEAYAQVENKAQKHAQAIIDAFKKGDWRGLGSYIADNLAKALEAIPWDKIKSGAGKFGKGLAEFMNGLLDPKLFEDIGITWAEWLNTKFTFIGNFVKHFDWSRAGFTFASAINGFINTIDVKLIATAMSDAIKGALDMTIAFISNINWRKLGEKIGEYLANIDWIGILRRVATLLWTALNSVLMSFSGLFDANPIAGVIVAGIVAKLTTTKLLAISEAIATGCTSSGALSVVGKAAATMAAHFNTILLGAIIGYNIGDKIAEAIYGEEWTLSNNFDMVAEELSGKGQADREKVAQMAIDATNRSEFSQAKNAFVNAGLDADSIYRNLDALQEFSDALGHLGDLEIDLSDYDAFEEALTRIQIDYGDLDEDTIQWLTTLQSSIGTMSDVDKASLQLSYGIKFFNDRQLETIQSTKAFKDRLNELPKTSITSSEHLTKLATSAFGLAKEIDKSTGLFGKFKDKVFETIGITDEASGEYDDLSVSLAQMGVSSDELSDYLAVLKDEDIPGISEKASEMVDVLNSDIPTSIQTFQDFATDVKKHLETVKSYWTDTFLPLFTEDALTQAFANLEPTVTTIFEGMAKAVVGIVNRMIDAINDAFDISWDAVEVNGEKVVEAGSAQLIKINRIEGFMNGGFPSGDIFMANEYGNAEMIGRIGNNTAVANNDQIVNAVSSGVRGAIADIMIPYLSQIASDTRECANKDLEVNIGDREIARANARGVSSMGRTIIQTI
jgi:predicted lipid-binding transport protein (Tim44 family)